MELKGVSKKERTPQRTNGHPIINVFTCPLSSVLLFNKTSEVMGDTISKTVSDNHNFLLPTIQVHFFYSFL